MLRALDLAEAIDAGDLTPAAVLELAAEAISERERDLMVFASLDLETARIKAQRLKPTGGLYGLPIGLKDIIDTASMPTEYGSPVYKGHRPKSDATIAVMTETACGLILGKTATTEFAFLNPAPTFNPHDPERTPGGSSAGSAAGVAAGMLPLAFGTQTGGSMLRPASYCGVACMKPSYRLLPMVGVKPFAPLLDTLGLFGARVVDVAFGLAAITGRDLRVDNEDFGTPSFGVTRLPFAGDAEPDSVAALEAAIVVLRRAGANVVELELPPELAAAHEAHRVINNVEGSQSLMFEHHRQAEAISPILLDMLRDGAARSIAEFDRARSIANRARKAIRPIFETVDVILTYSAPGVAPMRDSTGDARFNKLVTLLGLPAVSVPFYRTSEGLPVGIQVAAAFGDDRRALAAAAWLEARKP